MKKESFTLATTEERMRFHFNRQIGITIALLIILTVIGMFTELIGDFLPSYLKQGWVVWSGLAALFILAIWFTVLQVLADNKKEKELTDSKDSSAFAENRRRLVYRVSTRYKKYPFPKGATYVYLDLQSSDAEVQPLPARMLERLDVETKDLDVTNRSIREVFAEQGNELLILGEPGAGKTTLLYELALELADFAHQNTTEPVPIVLNLSSWQPDKPDLNAWIIRELQEYGVGEDFAKVLITNYQIILLLDGLDEVAQEQRNACVAAINVFLKERTMNTVVCCRRTEYDLIKKAGSILKLNSAVAIKPIPKEKVSTYLQQNGLINLQQTFLQEPVLQELLTTPLWLGVARQAFVDKEDLLDLSDMEAAKCQLWQAYIQQALLFKKLVEDVKHKEQSSRTQILAWIKWLASYLQKRDLTYFYLEGLQPNLLSSRHYLLYKLICLTTICLVMGLVIGTTDDLANDLIFGSKFKKQYGLAYGLIVGLASGLAGSLVVIIEYFLSKLIKNSRIIIGIAFGLAFGLSLGLSLSLAYGEERGLEFGISVGLALGLGSSILIKRILSDHILVSKITRWSWYTFLFKGLPKGLFAGLMTSLATGLAILFFGVLIILSKGMTHFIFILDYFLALGFLSVLAIFLSVSLALGTQNSWNTYKIEDINIEQPNEGIRRSLYFSMRSSLYSAGSISIVIGMLYNYLNLYALFSIYSERELLDWHIGIVVFGIIGVHLFLKNGFESVFQHYTLRYFLSRTGKAPFWYIPFLEHCCRLGLLRRVGGGYTFYHRELRDYLAKLYQQQEQETKKETAIAET